MSKSKTKVQSINIKAFPRAVGLSRSVETSTARLNTLINRRSTSRGLTMSDFLSGRKDERTLHLDPDVIALSEIFQEEAASGRILHPLAEIGVRASEIRNLFDSIAVDAWKIWAVLRNPLVSKSDDARLLLRRSKALRVAIPKSLSRRSALEASLAGPQSEFFDSLERHLEFLERRIVESLPKRKRLDRRPRDVPRTLTLNAIDSLVETYFGSRLKKRQSFVIAVLRFESLSHLMGYDRDDISVNLYRTVQRSRQARRVRQQTDRQFK
ncbi:hypothetical protein BH10BDE1_BH10BDE1_27850 [soil metagenome]